MFGCVRPDDSFSSKYTFGLLESEFLLVSYKSTKNLRHYTLPLPLLAQTEPKWDLLQSKPNPNVDVVELEMDHFVPFIKTEKHIQQMGMEGEKMVAGTLWATYVIYCKLKGLSIGAPVPLSVILPSSVLPDNLRNASVRMKGCYQRRTQFRKTSNITELNIHGPVLNAPGSKHLDVFLQVEVGEKNQNLELGFQIKNFFNVKDNTATKPGVLLKEAKKGLTHPNMYILYVGPFSEPDFASYLEKRNETDSVEGLKKISHRMAITNGSGWLPFWFLVYKEWCVYDETLPLRDLYSTKPAYTFH